MDRATVIAALPPVRDRINKISSEAVPHLTLLYLGTADLSEDAILYVQHACAELSPFGLSVDYRGELGPDKADVLFFENNAWDLGRVNEFRHHLLLNDEIKRAFDVADQYPEWTPHLTLGYPETPAREKEDEDVYMGYVQFDRIAVWMGDFSGPEFRLKYDDMMDVATYMSDMSTAARGAHVVAELFHFGTKGMRWGVRKKLNPGSGEGNSGGGHDPSLSSRQRKKDDKWRYKVNLDSPGLVKSVKYADKAAFDAINNKPEYKDLDFTKSSPLHTKYQSEINGVWAKAMTSYVAKTHGVTNPSKTKKMEWSWNAEHESYSSRMVPVGVKHADGEDVEPETVLLNDEDGYITGFIIGVRETDAAEVAMSDISPTERGEQAVAELFHIDLAHRNVPAAERKELKKKGAAKPDESFPIANAGDLDSAIKLAKSDSDRRHVIKNAKRLGLESKIPDTWNADGTLEHGEMTTSERGGQAAAELFHYGVKGMKWGVNSKIETSARLRRVESGTASKSDLRKTFLGKGRGGVGGVYGLRPKVAGRAADRIDKKLAKGEAKAAVKEGKKATKQIAKADKKYDAELRGVHGFVKVNNAIAAKINPRLDTLNAKSEYKDKDLTLPQHAATHKKYINEYRSDLQKSLNEVMSDLGTNASGTKRLQLEVVGEGLQTTWQGRMTNVQHAAAKDVTDGFVVVPEFNKFGLIVAQVIRPLDEAVTHYGDGLDRALSHYGVKGMKWGVTTKDGATSVTKISEKTALRSKKPVTVSQRRAGTYVKAKGGQRETAHDDAVRAQAGRRLAKKSTTDALSNKQLKDTIERMRLEQEYSKLDSKVSRKGQSFVARLFRSESARSVATDLAKKVAATAAVA